MKAWPLGVKHFQSRNSHRLWCESTLSYFMKFQSIGYLCRMTENILNYCRLDSMQDEICCKNIFTCQSPLVASGMTTIASILLAAAAVTRIQSPLFAASSSTRLHERVHARIRSIMVSFPRSFTIYLPTTKIMRRCSYQERLHHLDKARQECEVGSRLGWTNCLRKSTFK